MKRIGMLSLLMCIVILLAKGAYCQYPSASTAPASTTESGLNSKISIDFKDVSVRKALEELFKVAGTAYVIDSNIAHETLPSVKFVNVSLQTALDTIAKSAGLVYRVDGEVISVSKKPLDQARDKTVSIEAKDMPLREVIEVLFKDTGHGYSIDPSVTDLKVTAKLQNVPFEEALKTVVRTSGLVYRMDGNTFSISPKPVISQTSMDPADTAKPTVTEVVVLKQKQISSGDIASVISKPGKLAVTTVGPDKLMITGNKEDVDEALKLVRALDTDVALVRPIRIKLEAKVTSTSLKEPRILTTESVGAEGSPIPLNATAETMIPYNVTMTTTANGKLVQNKVQQFINVVGGLTVKLVPTLGEDGRISLSGSGRLAHVFLGEKRPDQTVADQFTFDKDFEVAISVPQGKPTVIATASVKMDKHTADLEITATAVVEEGMVRAPAPDNTRPSFGGGYSTGGGGYGGGGFGGGSYGGSSSGANKGW